MKKRYVMRDVDERDTLLWALYGNKEVYEFLEGKEHFNQEILEIWRQWTVHEPCKTTVTVNGSTEEYLKSPEFLKMCWEIDNGFTDD